jgi:hypothetical protein
MLGISKIFTNFIYGPHVAKESKKYQKKRSFSLLCQLMFPIPQEPLSLSCSPSLAHPPPVTSMAHPLSHSDIRVSTTGKEERP